MHDTTPVPAQLPMESAVYQRTEIGQRALLRAADFSASPKLRLLARLNGFTHLRYFLDLASEESATLVRAIDDLLREGLIERVEAAERA
jgi:hypothetical protein